MSSPKLRSKLRLRWRLRQLRTRLRRWFPVGPRRRDKAGEGGPHWVVCFYGVDRSLAYTAWGIAHHIFRPLERASVRITVVAHFNRVGTGPDRIHLLNPDVLWLEPQDPTAVAVEIAATEGLDWPVSDPSLLNAKVNLAHQLHSLSRVHELLEMADLRKADVFAVLRSDLQYLDDIDVSDIQSRLMSGDADLITPSWEQWDGLNDRFAFLSGRALEPVMMRRKVIGQFGEKFGFIQSERLLEFAASEAHLRLGLTKMRAERVRANGLVRFENFTG